MKLEAIEGLTDDEKARYETLALEVFGNKSPDQPYDSKKI